MSSSLDRREFIASALCAAGAAMIPACSASAAKGKALSRPALVGGIDSMPARPREIPVSWRAIANNMRSYIHDPKNGILIKRSDGTLCFASATESQGDGGLTTFGPVVLGEALRGEDVREFTPSLANYFNERVGIFIDGVESHSSEYWYLMNVNALAAALTRKAMPGDEKALERVRRSADQLIRLAQQIGYNFNDQGYDFAKSAAWTDKDIYRQPDAVAGFAYNMLLAYEMLGDAKYLSMAKAALSRYLSFGGNPWYQLPSGAMACLVAARLSSHYHSTMDLQKAFEFLFDPAVGCLQLGEWGGREVNGLMGGWRNEPRGQAYSMESMVVLPYLLPALRYAPQYATAVGRYVLNLAANLRFFYPEYLPAELQSKPGVAPAIPYERLSKEVDGHSPYATGDFAGHRSVYGGAYALWLGEIILPTEDAFILQLDLAKTDFLARSAFSTYLYHNPWDERREVTLSVPAKSDVYDLQSQSFVSRTVQGAQKLSIPPHGSRLVVITPSGAASTVSGHVLSVAGVPVDYHV